MNLWVIFLTGLTVGGFSCMAVQGGLLASTITAREGEDLEKGDKRRHTIWPTFIFLAVKLVVYIILGFILGMFGEKLQISDTTRTYMQIAAGLYMVAVALDLLKVHPIFRYAVIQPPKFLFRLVRNQSKSKEFFAPAFLGAMTIFVPCGTTLAMEALAISSGNPVAGASIMGAFVLGTTPLFFVLGYLATAFGDAFKTKFLKLAALIVLYLGITSLNGGLVLAGSPVTIGSIIEAIPISINLDEGETDSGSLVGVVNGVQVADIQVLANGYQPRYIKVKSGVPVKLNLISDGSYGCATAFTIPKLGIRKRVPIGGSETVEFTPSAPGKIIYTCSMGMYSGVLEVI